MKPDAFLVRTAVEALSEQVGRCVFVGDSVADMVSGRAVGVHLVGYANKPGKQELLGDAGAEAVTTSMAAFEDAVLGR